MGRCETIMPCLDRIIRFGGFLSYSIIATPYFGGKRWSASLITSKLRTSNPCILKIVEDTLRLLVHTCNYSLMIKYLGKVAHNIYYSLRRTNKFLRAINFLAISFLLLENFVAINFLAVNFQLLRIFCYQFSCDQFSCGEFLCPRFVHRSLDLVYAATLALIFCTSG